MGISSPRHFDATTSIRTYLRRPTGLFCESHMPGDVGRQTTIEYSSVPISRRWDRTAALPLVLWSSLACLGFFIQIAGQWPAKDSIAAVRIASELSSAAFLAQQAILLCIR